MTSHIDSQSPMKQSETKLNKDGKQVTETLGEAGSKHTYSLEEKMAFSKVINEVLADDELLAERLPIDPETDDLFTACDDGIIFCKLVNKIQPDTVNDRVLKKGKNIFEVKATINMALSAIKAVGGKVFGTDAELIIKHTEHLILGLLWQLIKLLMNQDIDILKHPEMIKLAEGEEEFNDLLAMPKEKILIRWMNWHLKEAGSDRRIKNFGKDIKDSVAYTTVINHIENSAIGMDNLDNEDMSERAKNVIQGGENLGAKAIIIPKDITSGNVKLNTIFAAKIFNENHGLPPLNEEEEEEFKQAELMDDDIEGTREERAFRMWINSLDLGDDQEHVNNLYEECKDGLLLMKVMD